ncbi:serine hydrolase domain-containing protein [Pedobacter sp. NJ-S-72]
MTTSGNTSKTVILIWEYKGKPIQLVHLANLTSALPDNLPEKLPSFKTEDKDAQLFEIKKFYDTYTREQFLKDLKGVRLTAEPGLNNAHSNTAAQLLGFILENIYKKSYNELLKQYITGPLDMQSTFAVVPNQLKENIALGYNNNGVLMPGIPAGAGSAGVLKSTLPDMVKYVTRHLEEVDRRLYSLISLPGVK